MEEFNSEEVLLDKKVSFSFGESASVAADESSGAQKVDIALQKIHTLFQEEVSSPLSALEDGLRAWTRSHLRTEDIAKVTTLAARAREEFSVLVIVGIGGSDLSARVFHDSFNHPYHNLLSSEERGGAPEVYFTGDTFDPRKLAGLLEMLKARNLLHKTLFNVISKSGTTTETMATLMIIRGALISFYSVAGGALTPLHPPASGGPKGGWQKQVLATTGLTSESVLFRMHEQSPFYGETLLPVPDGVGGRFSAFSPVGLFFLAATAGRGETPDTRIRSVLSGVEQAHDDFKLPYAHPDNIAYQLARWIHLAEEIDGKGTLIFYNYADNTCLGDWFVQLYTESIQERGGGANVIPAKGPTSNHSILNGIIAGPRDKVVLFIHWKELGPDLGTPTDAGMDSKLTEFEGVSMTHMQTASYRGTALDFSEKGVPTATLTLPQRDIQSVCQLMRILMDTIAVKGRLQGLHLDNNDGNELTYLQDGVEGYKRNFRQLTTKENEE